MTAIDTLLELFRDGEAQDEFGQDPEGYLAEHGGITPEEFLDAMPEVCDNLPPEQAEVLRAAYGLESPEGAPELDEGLADQIPPVPQDATTAELMEHYATVINVSHSIHEEGDTIYIDQSVNQNIEAYGDVNQTFDQEAVAGEGAVLAGDGSQVNTGDGAVQSGGDVSDSTVATGDVQGSVTGDNEGSTVGDGNAVISDSDVGAANFGSGDATNMEGENVNAGDGTIVSDVGGDANVNSGDGDLTSLDGSEVSESAIGDGDVSSDDASVSASEGSSVAFGFGSTSSAEDQDTEIDDNFGEVQVADDGSQEAGIDGSTNDSFDTDDSFNSAFGFSDGSTSDSYNDEGSYNDESYDTTATDASDDDYTETDNSYSDDDGQDIDVDSHLEDHGLGDVEPTEPAF